MDLLVVFKLLQRENVLVEIFLKLLVCIVDVELLEAVHLCEGTRETRKSVVSFMKNCRRIEHVDVSLNRLVTVI